MGLSIDAYLKDSNFVRESVNYPTEIQANLKAIISGFMSIWNPWRSEIDFPLPHHIYTIIN